jgi:uncharacterized protein (TIGR00661 family)
MSTIFYGVCGEGRGHATRVKTMVEELRQRHDIHIFAPAMAHEMLEPLYRNSSVRVHRIPGLCFAYDRLHRVHFGKTGWSAAQYLLGLPEQVRRVSRMIDSHKPDLVITDFEPIVSRAAEQCGIPYISLDHQQFLLHYDLSGLPSRLRRHAFVMGQGIKLYYSRQEASIVSSFYFPPLKSTSPGVTQIGVLLRPEILKATPETGDFLVAYLRRNTPPHVLRALAECRREVRVYGLGKQPDAGKLKFFEIDFDRFIADLACCRALVSTAGNQLVGEALYLQKPVLAMPEANNHEQQINAAFLAQSGAGEAMEMAELNHDSLSRFMARFEAGIPPQNKVKLHGNPTALRLIHAHLGGSKSVAPAKLQPQLEPAR